MKCKRFAVAVLGAALAGAAVGCADQMGTTARTEVVFCRDAKGVCSERVASLIDDAQETIQVAMYTFTHDELAQHLVDAVDRGVQVWVVYETDQEDKAVVDLLQKNGIYVRRDGNPAIMHHKFAVFDGQIVETGSFNWTWPADNSNDENLVVLDSKTIAGEFQTEFLRLWEQGTQ